MKCWGTTFAKEIACDTSPENGHVIIFSEIIAFLSRVIQLVLLTVPTASHDSFNRLSFKMPSYALTYCTAVSFCFDCVDCFVTNNLPLCQFCCIAGNQFFITKFRIRFSCFQKILEEYPTSSCMFEIVSEKTLSIPQKIARIRRLTTYNELFAANYRGHRAYTLVLHTAPHKFIFATKTVPCLHKPFFNQSFLTTHCLFS